MALWVFGQLTSGGEDDLLVQRTDVAADSNGPGAGVVAWTVSAAVERS